MGRTRLLRNRSSPGLGLMRITRGVAGEVRAKFSFVEIDGTVSRTKANVLKGSGRFLNMQNMQNMQQGQVVVSGQALIDEIGHYERFARPKELYEAETQPIAPRAALTLLSTVLCA